MEKILALALLASAATKQETATIKLGAEIENEMEEIVQDLLQEKCVWPYCGNHKYEICLMPDGCVKHSELE